MTRDDFEGLVAEALDAIPEEFARYLENVAVVVEDWPSTETLRSMGLDPRRESLYGLYQGVPLKRRPHDFAGLPDRITIFAGPLMRDFPPRELRRQIETTVVHEIAHFFGLDEPTVRRLGY
jgi:predicted Zn-dependent protease with MMP-like domain